MRLRAQPARWRPIVLIAIVVLLFVAALALDLGERLQAAERWIEHLGPWGPPAFIAIYVAAAVLMVPATGPTLIAGGLFGSVWGTVWVSVGATIGAIACFAISRYFARDATASWLQGKPLFARLDRLTETHGAWIVAITRLVPIFPYNLLNYAFGLTRVRFSTYAVVSWIAMLPATFLYVAGGEAAARVARDGRVPWTLVLAAVTVLAALLLIVWVVRGKLRSAAGPRR